MLRRLCAYTMFQVVCCVCKAICFAQHTAQCELKYVAVL